MQPVPTVTPAHPCPDCVTCDHGASPARPGPPCSEEDVCCVSAAGIAYLGGVCSAKRKCVLAEDNGLNLAFTIAHELGHT